MSILMSHMKVTKNPQNVHRKCFWTILVTYIFDVKIDINMCEPHYVNLFFVWTSSIVCVFDFLTFDIFLTFWHFDIFLGGLSLHLNHLIQSRMEISYRLFETLAIGLLLSNLDSRQLETSPMTSYYQFWNMSIFGDSRAIQVICQKRCLQKINFFLDEGVTRLQQGWGF